VAQWTKPHWLAPGTTTTTPPVVISFDTETYTEQHEGKTVQRLRCWDAVVRVRTKQPHWIKPVTYHEGESAATLADLVQETTTAHSEVWVIAHNVSFDLAVTSLPFILVDRDWTLDGVHLGEESTWWVLVKGKRKVIITDSWSWLRCSLSEAAKDIKRRKVRLPDQVDDLATWHARCKKDAQILDEIIDTVMSWWQREQLGKFAITGAACGWRSLRQLTPPKRLLVGPDGDRTTFERRAIFGGLKDVYGVGQFHDTWFADYDFVGAYPSIMAAHPLPSMPSKPWSSSKRLLESEPPSGRDYIAEVEITTHVPCAPCRVGDEIFSPVGTFRTVLSGPEVRYAQSVADSVTVISHRAYRTGYALADWAAWCLKVQNDTSGETPEVVKRITKGWGRSVSGRFAARTSQVIDTNPAMHLGWHLETGHDLDTGRALEYLSIGGVTQTIAKDLDGADVFPAVLAFIEGHCRVALRQMIATRDPRYVLQCNTDGWWEMRATRRSDYTPDDVPWPHRIVRKALERRLLVNGPNHVMTPHERRYSGVPANAIEGVGGKMKWSDWPGLRWQLEYGATGEYHRPEREVVMASHYVKRWVLDSGETIPVTTRVAKGGLNAIEPWCRSWGQREGDVLSPYQVESLIAVNESDRVIGDSIPDSLPTQPGRDFPITPRGGQLRTVVDEASGVDPSWSPQTAALHLG
jgi:hypothetical protein